MTTAKKANPEDHSQDQETPTLPPSAEPSDPQGPEEKAASSKDVGAENEQNTPPRTANMDMILDIPVQLTVELGRAKMSIREVLKLAQGSVIELDGLAGEPMKIYANGHLIARGEVIVMHDRFGIRLSDVVSQHDRLSSTSKKTSS
jgi:flagellar motor switch protein FliN/FliY